VTRYFVKSSPLIGSPSDSNDGLDPFGFGLSGAAYVDLSKQVQLPGAFASYTHEEGDVIYLTGGSSINVGLYEIASKVSNDAIELVKSAGSNSTSVTSSSGPKLTIQAGVSSLGAGDDLVIGNDGTYSISSPISCIGSGTVADGPKSVSGGTSRCLIDGTRVSVVQMTTATDIFESSSAERWEFRNLNGETPSSGTSGMFSKFEDSVFDNCKVERTSSPNGYFVRHCQRCVMEQCSAINVSSFNLQVSNESQMVFIECWADQSSGAGFQMTAGSVANYLKFIRCRASRSGLSGFLFSGDSPSHTFVFLTECLAENNTENGLFARSWAIHADHCLFDSNSQNGVELQGDSDGVHSFNRCTFSRNAEYGIDDGGGLGHSNIFLMERYNQFLNNDAKAIRVQPLHRTSTESKTGNPFLESATVFHPTASSPNVAERIDWPDDVHFTIRGRYAHEPFKGTRLGRMRVTGPGRDSRRRR